MKILICTFTFPPNKDGVAAAAWEMARGLAERGLDITVATGFLPERVDFQPGPNLSIHQFKIEGASDRRVGFRGDIEEYRKFLRQEDWAAVIFHSWGMWPSELAWPVLQDTRSKLIMVSHGFGAHKVVWHKKFPWGLGTWIVNLPSLVQLVLVLRKHHAVVYLANEGDFNSFFDLTLARMVGYPGIHIIPNGIDSVEGTQKGTGFRKSLGIPVEAKVFVCVANYSRRKNQIVAARAFRRARLAGAHLVFIGSEFNEYSRMYQKEEQTLSHDFPEGTVHWLEKMDRPATLAAVSEADCAVLSARNEAQPIVLLEAMRAEKPWIALKAGCIASMEGGICVASEKEMTAAMRRISESPVLARELGAAGRYAVETRYTREKYVESYAKLITELTLNHSQPKTQPEES